MLFVRTRRPTTDVSCSVWKGDDEMSEKLIFNCTHGKEDPERASLPFVAGNVARTAGQEAIVFCTIEAGWLGTKGGNHGKASKGLEPLSEIYFGFVVEGGKVWVSGACP